MSQLTSIREMRTRSSRPFGDDDRANLGNITYRLPPELLSMIFLNYKEDITQARGSRMNPSAVPWLPPSHVSSHWRTVALNTPRFWNFIPLNNIEACKELIKRSKQTSLHVCKRGTTRYASGRIKTILMRCLEMVMAQSHRVQMLDLGALHAVTWKHRPPYFVKAFDQFNLQVLQSLVIDTFCVSDSQLLVSWIGPFLQRVIQEQKDTLARLALIACPPRYWSHIESQCLTCLDIVILEIIPLNTIFDVLGRLPNLERFSLDVHDGGWPNDPITVDHTLSPISLPFLQDLQLNTSSIMTCSILKALKLPPSVDIHIERLGLDMEPGTGYAGLKEVVQNLRPYLAAHEAANDEETISPFKSMFLTCMPWSLRLGFTRANDPPSPSLLSTARAVQVKNNIDLVCANSTTAEGLSSITELLMPVLSHVERLVVRLDRDEPIRQTFYELFERPWLVFASQMPALRTLEVAMSRYSQPMVLQSLSLSSDPLRPYPFKPFPILQELVLEGLRFEAMDVEKEIRPIPRRFLGHDLGWGSEEDEDIDFTGLGDHQEMIEVQSTAVLYNMLNERKAGGFPLLRLGIRKAEGVEQPFIETISSDLVDEVQWDGAVNSRRSENGHYSLIDTFDGFFTGF
ncbi:hypothetical protein DL96DRAFT_1118446 [Flagelloscypha sp. PMI_526]|nr:hypothetical protein DL96DRAFT_1118446 [Flagelloscypha sp. PMI_526]